MSEIEKFPLTSMDITAEQKEKLKQLFPEVFTEGDKIDWDKLRLTLGENVDVGKERFGMNWPGKADCFKIIQQPSLATLIPARDESVNFDTTENLFIEGDNLEVLKLLQKSYLGKIKMIYIDPPYNTGNDFIYPDNYSETLETYLAYTGQVDSEGRKFSTNTDTEGRFHSKWMNMMYPRLFLAKNLLKDDGLIFISIDDKEVDNLKKLCNEIFGEENIIEQIVWKSKFGAGAKPRGFITLHEYILCYSRNASLIDSISVPMTDKARKMYYKKDEKFADRGYYGTWPLDTTSMDERPNLRFPIIWNGKEIWPKKQWLWSKERVDEALRNNELIIRQTKEGKFSVRYKKYEKDKEGTEKKSTPLSVIDNIYTQDGTKELVDLGLAGIFDFPKPAKLIKEFIKIETNETLTNEDIILDFFAGSGSTGQASLELNFDDSRQRKFILIQLPEKIQEDSEPFKTGFKTISDICKERIRRVLKKIEEDQIQNADMFTDDDQNFDLGFKVFKLAPSNFSTWNANVDKTAEAIGKQLELHVDHISDKADQEAILYELLLKSGFELTTKIEKLEIVGKTVFSIGEGELLICLERELTNELIKAMAERKPARVICLDEGFQNNDQLKTNAALIMKTKGVVKFQTV